MTRTHRPPRLIYMRDAAASETHRLLQDSGRRNPRSAEAGTLTESAVDPVDCTRDLDVYGRAEDSSGTVAQRPGAGARRVGRWLSGRCEPQPSPGRPPDLRLFAGTAVGTIMTAVFAGFHELGHAAMDELLLEQGFTSIRFQGGGLGGTTIRGGDAPTAFGAQFTAAERETLIAGAGTGLQSLAGLLALLTRANVQDQQWRWALLVAGGANIAVGPAYAIYDLVATNGGDHTVVVEAQEERLGLSHVESVILNFAVWACTVPLAAWAYGRGHRACTATGASDTVAALHHFAQNPAALAAFLAEHCPTAPSRAAFLEALAAEESQAAETLDKLRLAVSPEDLSRARASIEAEVMPLMRRAVQIARDALGGLLLCAPLWVPIAGRAIAAVGGSQNGARAGLAALASLGFATNEISAVRRLRETPVGRQLLADRALLSTLAVMGIALMFMVQEGTDADTIFTWSTLMVTMMLSGLSAARLDRRRTLAQHVATEGIAARDAQAIMAQAEGSVAPTEGVGEFLDLPTR